MSVGWDTISSSHQHYQEVDVLYAVVRRNCMRTCVVLRSYRAEANARTLLLGVASLRATSMLRSMVCFSLSLPSSEEQESEMGTGKLLTVIRAPFHYHVFWFVFLCPKPTYIHADGV